MPVTGLEPVRRKPARDFKSLVSTIPPHRQINLPFRLQYLPYHFGYFTTEQPISQEKSGFSTSNHELSIFHIDFICCQISRHHLLPDIMLDFFLVIGYNNTSIQQYWIVYIISRQKICAVSRCCPGFFRLTADKLRQYRLMRRKNNKIYMERYRSGYNGLDSKSSVPEMVPWVRIPPAPLVFVESAQFVPAN